MKILKWLKKEKIAPINVLPGDSVTLSYRDAAGQDHHAAYAQIEKPMIIDEARIFTAEIENKDAIGGVFMGKKIK